MKKKLAIKQSEEEVPFEVMAESIVQISRFVSHVKKSRLSEKALLVLVAHSTGESQKTIKTVLDGLEQLEATYLRKS